MKNRRLLLKNIINDYSKEVFSDKISFKSADFTIELIPVKKSSKNNNIAIVCKNFPKKISALNDNFHLIKAIGEIKSAEKTAILDKKIAEKIENTSSFDIKTVFHLIDFNENGSKILTELNYKSVKNIVLIPNDETLSKLKNIPKNQGILLVTDYNLPSSHIKKVRNIVEDLAKEGYQTDIFISDLSDYLESESPTLKRILEFSFS